MQSPRNHRFSRRNASGLCTEPQERRSRPAPLDLSPARPLGRDVPGHRACRHRGAGPSNGIEDSELLPLLSSFSVSTQSTLCVPGPVPRTWSPSPQRPALGHSVSRHAALPCVSEGGCHRGPPLSTHICPLGRRSHFWVRAVPRGPCLLLTWLQAPALGSWIAGSPPFGAVKKGLAPGGHAECPGAASGRRPRGAGPTASAAPL